MNSKQRRTLGAVFATPTRANIAWADIESLFVSVGCDVFEGPGSAVAFGRGEATGTFHRPHPGKEAKFYQVRDARAFLTKLGVAP